MRAARIPTSGAALLDQILVALAEQLDRVAYGIASKHFWRDLRPTGPRAVLRDLSDALRFRLTHRLGHYTAILPRRLKLRKMDEQS
jgi:hypothetical protein